MSTAPNSQLMTQGSSLRHHLKATLVLGLPLVGAQIAQMLIGVTDTIMLGWLGTAELAAGTLAFQIFFILFIFGLGIGAAIVPLIAAALGKDDLVSVRRTGRMGVWALLGLAVIFMVPLWFTRDILLLLGQQDELAVIAQKYMRIAQWSMIPAFIVIAMRAFLTGLEKANTVLWITIATAVLNGVLNYMFIFGNWGAPRLGIEGAAVATVLANTTAGFASIAIVALLREAKKYELFFRIWKPDWGALDKLLRLGVPISLSIFAEVGMFAAASFMIGWLGKIPLAAHGIAIQIASVSFMIPLGLSQAGTVRVGNAAGRKDETAIGLAAKAVTIMCIAAAICTATLFLFAPGLLINLFLDYDNADAADVFSYAVPLLVTAAAFQIFDALQVASASNLRGLQDTKIPMVIATLSYWVIGIVSAYILTFSFGLGGVGVWSGLVIGLTVAGIALTHRFSRRKQLGLI